MEVKNFDERSEKILKYLRSEIRYDLTFLPRPFVIEITGTPDAGKTTVVNQLDNDLRKNGFRVICPQEGAQEIRHIERDTPLYNLRTGLYALQKIIDYTAGHLYDIVIMDRGIFDPYVWMMYWLEKGLLTIEEQNLYQQFFLSRFWFDKVDAVYFMTCEAEVAMRRHQRISQTKKVGETTNPESIKRLVNRYHQAYKDLKPRFPQISLIQTENLNEEEAVATITEQTLCVLERKAESVTTS